MDNTEKLESIIRSISLPLVIPQEALWLNGKARRTPDFSLIFSYLPEQLHNFLEPNSTASGKSGKYYFQLVDGRHLAIQIEDQAVVGMKIVKLCNEKDPLPV